MGRIQKQRRVMSFRRARDLITPSIGLEPLLITAPILFSSIVERPPAKFPGLTEYWRTDLQYSSALSYVYWISSFAVSGSAARDVSSQSRPTASTISSKIAVPPGFRKKAADYEHFRQVRSYNHFRRILLRLPDPAASSASRSMLQLFQRLTRPQRLADRRNRSSFILDPDPDEVCSS